MSHCLTALDDLTASEGLAEKDTLILHSFHKTQRANTLPWGMKIHTPKEKREEVWLTGYHFLGLVGLHVAVVLRSDWALGGFGTRIQTSIEWVGVVSISHNWSWWNHLKQEQSCDDLHPGEGTQEIPFIQCNKLKIIFVCWGMNEGKYFLHNFAAKKQKTLHLQSNRHLFLYFYTSIC